MTDSPVSNQPELTVSELSASLKRTIESNFDHVRVRGELGRSDNGPEFIAKALREWLGRLGVQTLYITPASPWENGYCESFNSKLRDELLAREIFYDLREAQVLIEGWRHHYNKARPHSSLGYKPPAPEAILPAAVILPYKEGVAA